MSRLLTRPKSLPSPLRSSAPRHIRRQSSSKPEAAGQWVDSAPPVDPRPSWVYSFSRISQCIAIPVAVAYAVFVQDFGDREHVFQPARRWLERQKAAFFSLSDAEREIAGVQSVDQGQQTIGTRQIR
ncbi:hypothetical protein WOLCODRAFT_162093 [Wolfiporia cocos MD-104 SS10]|uniref:Uncharacterized protein n=1 Tax=Wolfiporia cocos (strain MD-104) TaxID=742152 RepID=A0A2H3JDY5_WOLCO|nr:hypothetical protein WOLCODRAFT_162093 [Wolfiporia cocos MD-104 SS10]